MRWLAIAAAGWFFGWALALASAPAAAAGALGSLDELERGADRHEAAGEFSAAAELRRALLELQPDDVHTHWRLARDLVRSGAALPHSASEARELAFLEAATVARRGRELDRRCAECCMYEFAANAQLLTLTGATDSLPLLRQTGALVERCLQDPPSWAEPGAAPEAADLYYGAAAFFRRLPEGLWLRWATGTRGDPARAVALARRAARMAPQSVEYKVELGASLLCFAQRRRDAAARNEALELLGQAAQGPRVGWNRGSGGARALLAEPGKACSFGPAAPGLFQAPRMRAVRRGRQG